MTKGLLIFLGSCVLGINVVFLVFSFAALVYSSSLANYFYLGLTSFLIATIFVMFLTALFSRLPTVVAVTQNDTLPIYSIIALSIANALISQNAGPAAIFSTVLTGLACATFITSLAFIVLGYLRIGNLLAFMPYPIIGGFLSAVGWFLLKGGFLLLLPHFTWSLGIFEPLQLLIWLPAVIYLVLLLLVSKKLLLPFAITIVGLLGFTLFYSSVYFFHIPLAALRSNGFLMPSIEHLSVIPLLKQNFSVTQIHWDLILSQLLNIVVIAILSSIAMMLNTTGMETLTKKPLDINYELRVAGLATLLSSFFGGLPGYVSVSLSSVNNEIQSTFQYKTRLISLLTASVCILGLIFADKIISYFPLFLFAGMVMFFGVYFLKIWIIDSFNKIPLLDYSILLVILLTAIYLGLLTGILIGIMISILLFLVDFSTTKVIKAIFTGQTITSTHQREPDVQDFLLKVGEKILLIQIQQYLFFGNVKTLLQVIQKAIEEMHELTYIILDFKQVTGMDISSVKGFENINSILEEKKILLIFTNLSPRLVKIVKKNFVSQKNNLLQFKTYDEALEWCENQLLLAAPVLEGEIISFESRMANYLNDEALKTLLENFTETIEIRSGEFLFHQGENCRDLYFLKSGRIDIILEIPNQIPIRLRSISAGNTVGELAFYTSKIRSASAIAKEDSILQKISYESFSRLSDEAPKLAIAINRYVIDVLAERISYSNEQLNILFS